MSRELGKDSSVDQDLVDRRENPRYGMQVRVSVLGVDDRTTLHNETTETIDISAKGIRLIIGYPVHPGNHISITANQPDLQAKMAVFIIRWVQPYRGRYMIGAELVSPPEKWQFIED